MTTHNFYQLWAEARTRFSNQLPHLKETDLTKKLGNSPNSVGFLMRHIGDVELLFAKNVFAQKEVKISAKTVIDKHDTGEWTNLFELLAHQKYAFECLEKAILEQTESDWATEITTKNAIAAFIIQSTWRPAKQLASLTSVSCFRDVLT